MIYFFLCELNIYFCIVKTKKQNIMKKTRNFKNYLLHVFSVCSLNQDDDYSLGFSSLDKLLKKFDELNQNPLTLHNKGISILRVCDDGNTINIDRLFTHIYP